MHSTSTSLLERLRHQQGDDAWPRFVRLYTPLLYHWARKLGLQEHDAADLVQDVLLVLVRKLPEFEYQPGRSFRGWMRTVLLHKWRDWPRRPVGAALDSDVVPVVPDDAAVLEEEEYRQYVVSRALQMMQTDFEPATWKACWETVVQGRAVAEVAAALEMTSNAVYLARSRVLSQLRRDLGGLLD